MRKTSNKKSYTLLNRSTSIAAGIIAVVLGGFIFFSGYKGIPRVLADGSQSFVATEDAFVKSSTPSTNFGTTTDLEVQNDSRVMHSLIRFVISGLPADALITSTSLQLYVPTNGSAVGGAVNAVSGSWTESTVTWANAPAMGNLLTNMPNPVKSGAWSQAGLPTTFVTGNGTYDVYLSTSSTTDAVYYASNNSTFKPTLLVSWTSGIAPTATATPVITAPPTILPTDTPVVTPVPTATPVVTPTPVAIGDPVIAAAGDIGCEIGKTCHAQAVYNLIPPMSAAAILTLGDTQYYCGSAAAFAQVFNPSWGQSKSLIHPTVGNHEYLTSGAADCTSANAGAAGYYSYFGSAAGNPSQGYYSYDIGSWHFVSLNTQCSSAGGCGTSSPQYIWLKNDLAAHPNTCTLGYYHIPLYSGGGRANANSKQLYDLMYKNGVDVVLTGHDHSYERFAPQDANGNAVANGITEFVVGTGGANHTPIVSTVKNSIISNANTFGVLKMTLHSNSADYQFVPDLTSGSFTDSGSIVCH